MTGIKSAIRTTQLRTVNLDYNNIAPELIEKITKLFDTIAKYRRSKLVSLMNPNTEAPTVEYHVNLASQSEDKNLLHSPISPITVKTTTTTIMKITPIPALQRTSSMDAFARQLSPKSTLVGPSVSEVPASKPKPKRMLQINVPAKVVTTTTVETTIVTSPTADLRAPPSLLLSESHSDM